MRSRLFASLLSLTALFHPSLIHTAVAQALNHARVNGTVLDATQAPIAGAIVTAVAEGSAPPASTTTNSLGEFEFRLSPGRYTLAANAAGFLEFTEHVSVASSDLP